MSGSQTAARTAAQAGPRQAKAAAPPSEDKISIRSLSFYYGSKRALDEIAERSLAQAALWKEIKDRLHDSALALSGGQQQRLCIARVLAVDPEVILMDEPCSALDPSGTARIEETIVELKSDYTIIIVTHNMQQAARVSDRTAFLLEGKLVEYDDTERIFTNPSVPTTEDYITGRFG